MVDDIAVETTHEVETAPSSGTSADGPGWDLCGGVVASMLLHPLAAVLLVIVLVPVVVVAAVVAGVPFAIYSAVQIEEDRTAAYSDGIQRAALAHVQAIRHAMAKPTPELPPR